MLTVTICSDFGAQENKVCHSFHCFLSICHEVIALDATMLVFWMLRFKPTFSLSSFTFIKRLFSSSSLSAIRVVSSACLRLLMFLLAILIPACASSNLAFHMMYSAYKLNKYVKIYSLNVYLSQILKQSVVSCLFLTIASWICNRILLRHKKGMILCHLQRCGWT